VKKQDLFFFNAILVVVILQYTGHIIIINITAIFLWYYVLYGIL